MDPLRSTPSASEVATEVAGLSAGLGILTTVLFPFALPALLLAAAPLLLLAPVVLVAGILAAAFLLARGLFRALAAAARGLRAGRVSSSSGRAVSSAVRTPL